MENNQNNHDDLGITSSTDHHTHNCSAALEGRPCQFAWDDHKDERTCACGPVIDETNFLFDGTVFVVHQGVC